MDTHTRDAHTRAITEFVRLGFGTAHALSFEVGIGRHPAAFTAAINAIGGYNTFTPVVVIAAFRPLWDRLADIRVGRFDGSPFLQTLLPVITQQTNGHQPGHPNRDVPVAERRDLATEIVTAARHAHADAICCYQARGHMLSGGRIGAHPTHVWLWWD